MEIEGSTESMNMLKIDLGKKACVGDIRRPVAADCFYKTGRCRSLPTFCAHICFCYPQHDNNLSSHRQ